MASRHRRTRWVICASAVLALAVLVLAVSFFSIRARRRAARRAWRMNNLKQIGQAFHSFHVSYKRFPPAVRTDDLGRPLSSWRFQILPYVESHMIGIDYSKRWDDAANRWLSRTPSQAYCFSENGASPERLRTNVVAITGPGTAFDGDEGLRYEDLDFDMILAIEVAHSDYHWMEPGDLHIDEVRESVTRGFDGDGVHVLFASGEVCFLRRDVPLADLKKFFTIEGAKRYDREEVLGPYAEQKWTY
jgi:hypothetical protein